MGKIRFKKPLHKYSVHQICIFTNMGSSKITVNDGLHCIIKKQIHTLGLCRDEPLYLIDFIEKNLCFGARECEIKPTGKKLTIIRKKIQKNAGQSLGIIGLATFFKGLNERERYEEAKKKQKEKLKKE